MGDILQTLGSSILGLGATLIDQIYKLLGLPTLPSWLTYGFAYVADAMQKGAHMVSFLFPNEQIWQSYLSFIVIVETAVVSWKLLHFIISLVNKLRG